MGNNLSVNISGIFMHYILDVILNNNTIKLKLVNNYIDDLILIINHSELEPILKELNHFHPNIVLTHEIETGGELNNLNITIIKDLEGNLKSKWYEESIKNDNFLNFMSNHSIKK